MRNWKMWVGCMGLMLYIAVPARAEEPAGVRDRLDRLERLYENLAGELAAERAKSRNLELRLEEVNDQVSRQGDRVSNMEAMRRAIEANHDRLDAYFTDREALALPTVSAPGGSIVDRTQVGGYFDLAFYSNGRNSDDSEFQQHRFIVNVSSRVAERVAFNSEIELEGGGDQSGTETITPSVGNSFNNRGGGGEVSIEQAFVDVGLADWLAFRGGAILVPMGRLNVLHDSDIREFTERPLPATLIVPSTWTEAGVGIDGVFTRDELAFLPQGSSANYELYLFNGLRAGDGREDTKAEDFSEVAATIADSGLRDARAGFRDDNNDDKAVAGRIGLDYSPVATDSALARVASGTQIGLSGYHGALDDAERVRLSMVGLDLRTSFGDLFEECLGLGPGPGGAPRVELWAEGYRAHVRGGNDGDGGIPNGLYGWYAELHYRFMPDPVRDLLPDDMRDTAAFLLLARYNAVDLDTGIRSAGDRERTEFGLNFRPYPNVVFKTEYQINNSKSGNDFAEDQFVASIAVGF